MTRSVMAEHTLFVLTSPSFSLRFQNLKFRKIVSTVIMEPEFLELFDRAVSSELSNMAELRGDAQRFPLKTWGVAQGNSLSPLLGNLLLKNFDQEMNSRWPGIRCIRYIDDFILLGPNKHITSKAFHKAQGLLSQWQMTVALDKTDQGSSQQCFEFLVSSSITDF